MYIIIALLSGGGDVICCIRRLQIEILNRTRFHLVQDLVANDGD